MNGSVWNLKSYIGEIMQIIVISMYVQNRSSCAHVIDR